MNRHRAYWSQMHDYPTSNTTKEVYPMKKLTFVYTDLNTGEKNNVDFNNKAEADDFFDASYMYPICTFIKTIHKGGSYTASNYSYCI